MPTNTVPELSKTSCFKDDLPRIQRLCEVLEARERRGYSSHHVVSLMLDTLEAELGLKKKTKAA